MATNPQISYAAANAEANALAALCNSGKLRIYSGTIPTRADDSIGSAVLLSEHTLPSTAFGTAANGVITANAISNVNGSSTGTPSFFRIWNAAGTTCYIQGTVGTSNADLIMDGSTITSGVAVSITALTHTVPRGA